MQVYQVRIHLKSFMGLWWGVFTAGLTKGNLTGERHRGFIFILIFLTNTFIHTRLLLRAVGQVNFEDKTVMKVREPRIWFTALLLRRVTLNGLTLSEPILLLRSYVMCYSFLSSC